MRFSIGDMIFNRQGRPAVVIDRKDDQNVTVDSGGKKFEKSRQLGFVNGLDSQNRGKFESIVAKARQEKDPEARVGVLQKQANQLADDPSKWVLKRYIESEMAYIMNSEGIHPQIYQLDVKDLV